MDSYNWSISSRSTQGAELTAFRSATEVIHENVEQTKHND